MEEDPRLLFNAGRVAMMWDNYSRVFNIPKEVAVDFAPMWKSKKEAMTANAVRVLGIPKATKYPKEAFALLQFYMDPEGQKLLNKHQWGVPALRTVAEEDYMKQPGPPNNWKITAQALDHDATLRREPIFWEWFQLSHLDLGVELMNGQITLDQYMSRLTDAMNKALVKWQAQKK
jgi:ABC-type glycerol-3-phosphate transport system substrate-binding protein